MRISYKLFVLKGNCVHNLECDQRLAATSTCISENRMFWSLRLGSHDHISPVGRAVHRECRQLSSCDTRTSATDISLRKHFCLLRNNITQLSIVTASLNTQIEQQRGADEKGGRWAREMGVHFKETWTQGKPCMGGQSVDIKHFRQTKVPDFHCRPYCFQLAS